MSKFPPNSYFLLNSFWAQSWRMEQSFSVRSDGPKSESLVKKSSDQKMSLIFSLRIVNSWLHTKIRWPMSTRSEFRAHAIYVVGFWVTSMKFQVWCISCFVLSCTAKICAETTCIFTCIVVGLPFLETTIFFEWLWHYIKSWSFWTSLFLLFLMPQLWSLPTLFLG